MKEIPKESLQDLMEKKEALELSLAKADTIIERGRILVELNKVKKDLLNVDHNIQF